MQRLGASALGGLALLLVALFSGGHWRHDSRISQVPAR